MPFRVWRSRPPTRPRERGEKSRGATGTRLPQDRRRHSEGKTPERIDRRPQHHRRRQSNQGGGRQDPTYDPGSARPRGGRGRGVPSRAESLLAIGNGGTETSILRRLAARLEQPRPQPPQSGFPRRQEGLIGGLDGLDALTHAVPVGLMLPGAVERRLVGPLRLFDGPRRLRDPEAPLPHLLLAGQGQVERPDPMLVPVRAEIDLRARQSLLGPEQSRLGFRHGGEPIFIHARAADSSVHTRGHIHQLRPQRRGGGLDGIAAFLQVQLEIGRGAAGGVQGRERVSKPQL